MTQTIPQPTGAMQKSVKSWIASDYFKQKVALTLPKHLTADRFVRVALSALGRVPKLLQCTPESVLRCMMTCSELGLEPDGRRYHLIPFENRRTGQCECTGIIDYKGLVELAMNSGTVSSLFAQTVCEQDEFSYDTGEVRHTIDFRNPRGAMFAVYCVVKFKDGGKHTEVMTKVDVDRIRSRSKAAGSGPWVTDYEEMSKKTVFRRASKWIKLSPEVQDAIEREDDRSSRALVSEVATAAGMLEAPEPKPDSEAHSAIDVPAQAAAVPAAEKPRSDSAPRPSSGAELHTVQETLAELVNDGGFNFDDFQKWGLESGNIPDADSVSAFSEVPTNQAKRLLRAPAGLLEGLARVKGAQL